MFFRKKTKKKAYIEFISDGIPFELNKAENEPAIVQELRLRTEAAWKHAIDEINREKKARLLAEYRECLKIYRRQIMIAFG